MISQQENGVFGHYRLLLVLITDHLMLATHLMSLQRPTGLATRAVAAKKLIFLDLIVSFDCSFCSISFHHVVAMFVLNVEHSEK